MDSHSVALSHLDRYIKPANVACLICQILTIDSVSVPMNAFLVSNVSIHQSKQVTLWVLVPLCLNILNMRLYVTELVPNWIADNTHSHCPGVIMAGNIISLLSMYCLSLPVSVFHYCLMCFYTLLFYFCLLSFLYYAITIAWNYRTIYISIITNKSSLW